VTTATGLHVESVRCPPSKRWTPDGGGKRWYDTAVMKPETIIRLVGAILLEQNDVYGPPPICKDNRTATETGLAVVYPALSRSHAAAGPDGIRGSATRQMDELVFGSHHFIGLCRTRSDRFAITLRHPRKPARVNP
jgi:hypothetical protein